MSRIRTFLTSALFLCLILLAFPSAVFADTYSVSISTTQFIPATLNVSVGDTIRFINTTTATQSAKTTDADGFNTGNIGAGESKSVVVSNAGTFEYSSQYTPTLSGTVVVAASSTSLTDDSTASATTTSQPAQTQDQPVSGTFEVLLAVLAAGLGFIGLGVVSSRWQMRPAGLTTQESTIDLPSISVSESVSENDHDRYPPNKHA